MRAAWILPFAVLAAAALAVGSASAAPPPAPTGLHGFLLRADEPSSGDSFPRTPSFAWSPVDGAVGYEFQLSTSNTFGSGDNSADNAVFYDTNTLTSPVVAPPLALPWITGSPHALYARVRVTTAAGVSPWSADYGFDVEPSPAFPTPLAAPDPGVLRWTPVEGADAYQVWLVDLPNGGKIVKTTTNVLDEREFYFFHGSPQWIGTVHWRVRAVRSTEMGKPANSFPVASYGQWSPIYKSTNPALDNAQPLQLLHTISDVVDDGTTSPNTAPAHKLMPAFTWKGDTVTLPNGSQVSTELFRVEIFSDRQCLNIVYAGPAVGGRSWAPRAFGGSPSLPDPNNLAPARANFPTDGGQAPVSTFDGNQVGSVEDLPAASATTAPPPDAIPAGASQAVTTPPDTATFAPRSSSAVVGSPVDLWDTYWPKSGYYWTVMPVTPSVASTKATVAAPGASKGSTLVPVSDSSQYGLGQTVTIGTAPNSDTATVTGVGNGMLTLNAPLNFGHVAGEGIVVLGGGGTYKDVMLPQDLCAISGMRHEFGLWSEPPVSSPQAPFVTGLSSTGKLMSASVSSSQFYGRPLVAWTPALRAQKYEIEWSSSPQPFVAVGNIMTAGTAAVLPLTTGTWYYRVRGFDYQLPTGAQQMAWSSVQQLQISAPTFKVVVKRSSKAAAAPKKTAAPKKKAAPSGLKTIAGDGFSMAVPSTWISYAPKDGFVTFAYRDATRTATVNVLKGAGRGSRTFAQWQADLVGELQNVVGRSPQVTGTVVTLPAGKTVRLFAANATASIVQYYVQSGTSAYVITFEAKAKTYTADLPLFQKSINSFKLG